MSGGVSGMTILHLPLCGRKQPVGHGRVTLPAQSLRADPVLPNECSPVTDHLSKQYDVELQSVRSRVLGMGGLVERQLLAAIDAFGSGNRDAMQWAIGTDSRVDAEEVGMDEDCTSLIARRQPTACDLRLVLAISRIATDLERIGDKAAKIARISETVDRSGARRIPQLPDLQESGQLVVGMVRRALDSLARLDIDAAREVIRAEKEIKAACKAIMRQLITSMIEDPRSLSQALDMLWIAKGIERVGSHARNIAESVIYAVTGVDLRHSPAKTVNGS